MLRGNVYGKPVKPSRSPVHWAVLIMQPTDEASNCGVNCVIETVKVCV